MVPGCESQQASTSVVVIKLGHVRLEHKTDWAAWQLNGYKLLCISCFNRMAERKAEVFVDVEEKTKGAHVEDRS